MNNLYDFYNIPENENLDFEFIPNIIYVAGVTFENRQEVVKTLKKGDKLELIRDYKNSIDKNAIKVLMDGMSIGFIPKQFASILAPEMDAGLLWGADVFEINKFDDGLLGVKILLILKPMNQNI